MPILIADVRELTAEEPELTGGGSAIWYAPYRAYTDTEGGVTYRVDREQIKVKLVDGKHEVRMPVTPITELLEVNPRGIKGESYPWYVRVPDIGEDDEVYLFSLPRIDKTSMDPLPSDDPAWAGPIEDLQTDVATNTTGLATLADTVADLELGAASDSAVATQVEDGTLTGAAVDARVADGITGKADQSALDTEADTRETADQAIADALNAYATANNTAVGLKVTAPAAPADGQLIAWSTSLGAWTKVNPVGAGRIAAAVNTTGSVTALSAAVGTGGGVGTQVVIPSTAISVTNSGGRPVAIHFGATFLQNVAGVGSVYLALTETTSGNVDKVSHVTNLSNSISPVLASLTLGAYEFDIGVVTTTRTFTLRALLYTSSATCGGNILNSTANPSWIRAVAE